MNTKAASSPAHCRWATEEQTSSATCSNVRFWWQEGHVQRQLTGEGDEHLMLTVGAANSGESFLHIAALEKGRHRPFDDRPRLASARCGCGGSVILTRWLVGCSSFGLLPHPARLVRVPSATNLRSVPANQVRTLRPGTRAERWSVLRELSQEIQRREDLEVARHSRSRAVSLRIGKGAASQLLGLVDDLPGVAGPVSLTFTNRDRLKGQRAMYWIRRSMPAGRNSTIRCRGDNFR